MTEIKWGFLFTALHDVNILKFLTRVFSFYTRLLLFILFIAQKTTLQQQWEKEKADIQEELPLLNEELVLTHEELRAAEED